MDALTPVGVVAPSTPTSVQADARHGGGASTERFEDTMQAVEASLMAYQPAVVPTPEARSELDIAAGMAGAGAALAALGRQVASRSEAASPELSAGLVEQVRDILGGLLGREGPGEHSAATTLAGLVSGENSMGRVLGLLRSFSEVPGVATPGKNAAGLLTSVIDEAGASPSQHAPQAPQVPQVPQSDVVPTVQAGAPTKEHASLAAVLDTADAITATMDGTSEKGTESPSSDTSASSSSPLGEIAPTAGQPSAAHAPSTSAAPSAAARADQPIAHTRMTEQVDAAKAAWRDVELARVGRNVEASIATRDGEIHVTARLVRGAATIEATVPQPLMGVLHEGVTSQLRREIRDSGIHLGEMTFRANDEASPRRDPDTRSNTNEHQENTDAD